MSLFWLTSCLISPLAVPASSRPPTRVFLPIKGQTHINACLTTALSLSLNDKEESFFIAWCVCPSWECWNPQRCLSRHCQSTLRSVCPAVNPQRGLPVCGVLSPDWMRSERESRHFNLLTAEQIDWGTHVTDQTHYQKLKIYLFDE